MALTEKDKEFLQSLFSEMHREIDSVQRQIDNANERIDELSKIIKGDNGAKGVVTMINLLDQSMNQISTALKHIDEEVHGQRSSLLQYERDNDSRMATITTFCETCRSNINLQSGTIVKTLVGDKKESDFMSWNWFRERALWPLVVAVFTLLGSQLLNIIIQSLATKGTP